MSHHKHVLSVSFRQWLPLAVAIIVLSGLAYAAAWQNYRTSANDPQVQIAEDIADAVNSNQVTPDNIVSPAPTQDLKSSLAAFVVIYNATNTPIGASVQLDGKMPAAPSGVLDKAKQKGESRVTWEPQPGVRVAAVVRSFSNGGGYVLAGRLLREVEQRERNLLTLSAIGAAAGLLLTFAAAYLLNLKAEPPHHHHEHEGPGEAAI